MEDRSEERFNVAQRFAAWLSNGFKRRSAARGSSSSGDPASVESQSQVEESGPTVDQYRIRRAA